METICRGGDIGALRRLIGEGAAADSGGKLYPFDFAPNPSRGLSGWMITPSTRALEALH
jgi:hypothetical protein